MVARFKKQAVVMNRRAESPPSAEPRNGPAVEAGPRACPAYASVCQRLRQDILAGVFPWGGRLKIADLVERYGVSQMPIREAIQKLQGEGLLTSQPNCGSRVRKIDEKFIRDIYDLRSAIAVLLLQRAIPRLTDADLYALEIIIETHQQAERRGEFAASLEYNKQFHRVIYRVADHPDAVEIIERYWELIDAMRRQYGFAPGFMAKVIGSHQRLLEAFRRRDVEWALRLSAESSENSRNDLLQRMRVAGGSAASAEPGSPGGAP